MNKLRQFPIIKYGNGKIVKDVKDILAVEEPLEIFIDQIPHTLTMRLPDNDFELVAGILFSNGIIDEYSNIKKIRYCESSTNRIHVELIKKNFSSKDHVHQSVSSCGVCGKMDMEDVYMDIEKVKITKKITKQDLFNLMLEFETKMELFNQTGCVHAVGIYSNGLKLISYGEDIGRHNAFDKAIGTLLMNNVKSQAYLAICSSRLSFEMIQKAARVGVEILAGFSAPTSMAVELANMWQITLIGFLRKTRFNVYSYAQRIVDL